MSVVQIRPQELASWHAAQTGAVMIDVRERWEHATSSVAESEHLPPGLTVRNIPMSELASRVHELPHDTPLVVLCHHGIRSQSVANWLAHNDFGPVANLAGGIDAWSRELDAGVPVY
jgi:rhodanese-related sulfurtransferase